MTREQLEKLRETFRYRDHVANDLACLERASEADSRKLYDVTFRGVSTIDMSIPIGDVLMIVTRKLKALDAEIVALGGTLDAST